MANTCCSSTTEACSVRVNDVPMDQWRPDEVEGGHPVHETTSWHGSRAAASSSTAQALSPDGAGLCFHGEGRPPVTDGPFAETKDLVVGWMVIDVDTYERVIEPAGELSSAPGLGAN